MAKLDCERFLGSALFIFLLSSPAALAVDIKGRVVTPAGRPVAGAAVQHRASGARTECDGAGAFELSLPDIDKGTIEVSHPDYADETVRFAGPGPVLEMTIILVPLIRRQEEVVVTALRYPEPSFAVPASESVVTSETIAESMPSNIAEGLKTMTGVTNLGSGGFSLVPSIRGLARNRILILVDGARLTSDRRTGPSGSFVAPEDIERIEILRSPSSVFYGSDAVGGVIHILTKQASTGRLLSGKAGLRYGSINGEKGGGLSLQGRKGPAGYYLSFQGADAGNYSSPKAEVLQSQYGQANLFGKFSWETGKRDIKLSLLGARGKDIGKPNRSSSTKPTWYPLESQNLAQLHWVEKNIDGRGGDLSVHAFVNPNSIETRTDQIGVYKTKESLSKVRGSDLGFQIAFGRKTGKTFWFNGGVDLFGRLGAETHTTDRSFNESGSVTKTTEETPYVEGRRWDAGLFLSADYAGIPGLDLVGGVRFDHLVTSAKPGGPSAPVARDARNAQTGFLAASWKVSERLVAFANVSRAYRTPTLSEKFYTGISGRGFIIAHPGLKPETGLSLDGGIKVMTGRLFAGFYGFVYSIDDMIERYLVAERTYTYGNIERGRIRGIEFEVEYFPVQGWKLFGNLYVMAGKSLATELPLNDVPPFRAALGTKAWAGRFSAEFETIFQTKKSDPGPAEIVIPGFSIFRAKAAYRLDSRLSVYAVISNLSDRTYLARPDPEAMEEPGRSLSLGLTFSF